MGRGAVAATSPLDATLSFPSRDLRYEPGRVQRHLAVDGTVRMSGPEPLDLLWWNALDRVRGIDQRDFQLLGHAGDGAVRLTEARDL